MERAKTRFRLNIKYTRKRGRWGNGVREERTNDMTMNRVINWWIKGVLLAGMMMLAGMAEAVDVSSAEGLASANGFKGKANWSGNKVTLTGNVELSETITITGGDIVLDLDGNAIQNGYETKGWGITWKEYFSIDIFDITGGTLTIQGAGKILNRETEGHSTIWVNGGNLILQGGIISKDSPAGGSKS